MKIALFGKRHNLFFLAFTFLSIIVNPSVKASDMKNYNLFFSADDALFDIRVNGIPVEKHDRPKELSSSVPVNQLLRSGENIIEVNFRQSNMARNDKINLDKKLATNFFMALRLDVGDKDFHENIDLAYIEQDSQGSYKAVEKSLKNIEYKNTGEIIKVESISGFSDSEIILAYGVVFDSESFQITIDIDDNNLSELLWKDAIKVELTDDVKQKVIGKYQEIRSYIAHNDGASYLEVFRDVWDNTAKSYDLGGVDYYINNTDAMNPIKIGEGNELGEFIYSEDEYKFEHLYDDKLVRIVLSPIYWGEYHQISVSPIFYFDKDMNIHAASITTD